MIAIAPTAIQIPAFADSVRSDTYAIDYGRTAGIVTTGTADLLAVAVEAHREVTRICRRNRNTRQGNTAQWRDASRDYHAAGRAYATAAGITMAEASIRIQAATN